RLHGEPLAARAERPIAPREAIDLLIEICDALSAAHAAGGVHRDLKLDNSFIVATQDPLPPRVKILDWGIARVLQQGQHHTVEGQVIGTPAYLAPEQARGAPVTPKSDVYSLGVVAYRLLLGRLPFDADAANEVVAMHLLMPPPPPRSVWPQIPRSLEALLFAMLAKAPEDRPTMRDAAHRFLAARDELELPVVVQRSWTEESSSSHGELVAPRHSPSWPIFVAMLAIAAAVVLVALPRRRPPTVERTPGAVTDAPSATSARLEPAPVSPPPATA